MATITEETNGFPNILKENPDKIGFLLVRFSPNGKYCLTLLLLFHRNGKYFGYTYWENTPITALQKHITLDPGISSSFAVFSIEDLHIYERKYNENGTALLFEGYDAIRNFLTAEAL